MAGALHGLSPRRAAPFEAVNSGALTRELLLSELFGHERGAFSGAIERRTGLLAAAEGGTVFLDEVGELAPEAQAMLLRFLARGEVRAVGASRTRHVDSGPPPARSQGDETAAEAAAHRLGAGGGAQLAEDGGHVELRRVLADPEPLGDPPVREALTE